VRRRTSCDQLAGVDHALLHALNTLFVRHDAIEDPVVAYVNAAELLFAAMLVLAFLLAGGHRRRATRRAAAAAGLSAGLALLIARVVARLVERPRPFVADPGAVHLFGHHAPDPGFPSDHATAAFAIGVALFLRNRAWGSVVLVLATILAAGRVAMGVHFPSDVAAGALLGAVVALGLYRPRMRTLINRLADRAGALVGQLRIPSLTAR
jgi:undecaprenyl-diphosphatase